LQVVAIGEAEERQAEDVHAGSEREVDAECPAGAAQFGWRPDNSSRTGPGARLDLLGKKRAARCEQQQKTHKADASKVV
jgi:hypothetical protein